MENNGIDIILTNIITKNDIPTLVDECIKFYSQCERHYYHQVTLFILRTIENTGQGDDEIIALTTRLSIIIDEISEKCTCKNIDIACVQSVSKKRCDNATSMCHKYKHTYSSLIKLYDHIQLEVIRLNEIRNTTDTVIAIASNSLQEISKSQKLQAKVEQQIEANNNKQEILNSNIDVEITKFQKANEEFKEQSEILKAASKKAIDETKNIHTQVVSILGIFTAIVFAMFGGLTMINSIVQTMASDLGFLKACTLCLLIGIVIFNMLYGLLYSISKIIDKPIAFPHPRVSSKDNVLKRAKLRHPLCFWFNIVTCGMATLLIILYATEWIINLMIDTGILHSVL